MTDPLDPTGEELRRALQGPAPAFDLAGTLPGSVAGRVRSRQRRRQVLSGVVVAAVVAAVAVPLAVTGSDGSASRTTLPASPGTSTPGSTVPNTAPVPTTAPPPPTTLPPSTTTTVPPPVGIACTAFSFPPGQPDVPQSATASFGGVTATWALQTVDTSTGAPPGSQYSATTLTVAFDVEPVSIPVEPAINALSNGVIPWSITASGQQLCVVGFSGGPTAVLVGLFSGGAHCCGTLRAYIVGAPLNSAGIALGPEDAGFQVETVDGIPLVDWPDTSFDYKFSSYAGSGDPIRFATLTAQGFIDVTSQHPAAVTADAANWWSIFQKDPGNGLGILPAWAADECTLGQGDSMRSTLGSLQTQGKLDGTGGSEIHPGGTGAAYVQNLEAALTKAGYCTG